MRTPMSKEELRIEPERLSQTVWRMSWMPFLFACIAAILAVFAWVYTQRLALAGGQPDFIFLPLVHACLVLCLERSLSLSPLLRSWRYRLAFLLPVGLFLVHWLWLLAFWVNPAGLLEIVLVVTGAFAGALAVTAWNEGLWENNSPPSDQLQSLVFQRHLDTIGVSQAEPALKRAFDLSLAVIGLIASMPVWLLSLFLVWLEDPGPLLFVKNSVGKGGVNFRQFKLRTMVRSAEDGTGPVLASEGDHRVLSVGRLLRKTALDELPQLVNILLGQMSFVGPRPQRTVLVCSYLEQLPEYAERHRVLPGLAGLAQVAGDYYLTPRQKLRFDRLYIRYRGLGFDLKLLALAFLVAFWYRWRPGWSGRLPRRLLRFGSSPARSPTGSHQPPAS